MNLKQESIFWSPAWRPSECLRSRDRHRLFKKKEKNVRDLPEDNMSEIMWDNWPMAIQVALWCCFRAHGQSLVSSLVSSLGPRLNYHLARCSCPVNFGFQSGVFWQFQGITLETEATVTNFDKFCYLMQAWQKGASHWLTSLVSMCNGFIQWRIMYI